MAMEDDVLFADLSKQIALLIMDDDDEELPAQSPPVHVQHFFESPQAIMPPPYTLYDMGYRRESKGTGVFIPRSSVPRRKNRSGKSTSNSYSNNFPRHNDKPGVPAASRVASSTNSGALKNRA